MTRKDALKLFEDKKVRTVWDGEQEKWFLSIVDVIAALTESENPQVYWRVLKKGYWLKATKPLQIVTV